MGHNPEKRTTVDDIPQWHRACITIQSKMEIIRLVKTKIKITITKFLLNIYKKTNKCEKKGKLKTL